MVIKSYYGWYVELLWRECRVKIEGMYRDYGGNLKILWGKYLCIMDGI